MMIADTRLVLTLPGQRFIRPAAFGAALLLHGAAGAVLLQRSEPVPETLPAIIEMISDDVTAASAGTQDASDSETASTETANAQPQQQESLLGGVPDDSQLASKAKPQDEAKLPVPPLEEAKVETDTVTLAKTDKEQKAEKPVEKPPEKSEEQAKETQAQEARQAPATVSEGSDVQRTAQDGSAATKAEATPAAGPRGKGGDSARDVAMAAYGAVVSAEINKKKSFPAAARAAGARGTVLVEFTIAPDGSVAQHRLLQSSGFAVLDGAVQALFSEIRFPKPPRGVFTASIPIKFEIR
jgi:protein TonB